MNEELLQQGIYQLKILKDATIEYVSVTNTEYTAGTSKFSIEVIYGVQSETTEAKSGNTVVNID